MCGIVGVICKSHFGFSTKQVDIFEQLLRVDELRGEDSTGIIYVENDASFGIIKEASPASWAVTGMMKDGMLSDRIRKGKVLIGHNRKATVGRVTDDTAHPFVVDKKFAMVHNGTLRGHQKIKNTEVDSEALAHIFADALHQDISQEQLEEEMGKVDGAYATASFQQEENRVYLCRNSERPLYCVELPDSFIFGSEPGMVLWILGRNGVDISKLNGYVLKEHTVVSIDLSTNKVTHREFVPKKPIPPVTIQATGGRRSTATTTDAAEQSPLSKNALKRLKRRFLGQRHSFYVDDWVETSFPTQTLESGAEDVFLMGEFDGHQFEYITHQVHAQVNLGALFPEKVPDDLCTMMFHGRIAEVTYNQQRDQVNFFLEDVHALKTVDIKKTMATVLTLPAKWSANSPPFDTTPDKHPDMMTNEEWNEATINNRYDFTTQKWIPRENSPLLH